MMPDPGQPPDLLAPKLPIITRRRRPPTVSLARGLLLAGAVFGAVSATTLFIGSQVVVDEFWYTAAHALIEPTQIAEIADVIRTVLISSGVVAVVLAVGMGVCAIGVGRGRRAARTGALCLVGLSLCFGLGSASYTSLGRGVDWAGAVQPGSIALRTQVGQAYDDAMPGLLVGTAGGLTDLQALGYIAGAVLLLAPASRPHFRRRPPPADPEAAPPGDPETVRSTP